MNRQLDETSKALLDAAHKLLADDGPDALTVRRIATEAGMSTMNVYSRFGGKDGVIDELYADGYRRLIDAVNAVPESDDIGAELLDVARAYRQFALDNPTYYGIMLQSAVAGFSPTEESLELALGGLRAFVARVRRGQERGTLVSFENHDAMECAAWLLATCHGLISLELDGAAEDHLNWPSIFELGVRTAIAGLQPTATTTATG
jgi:AcrR family transcriptional regulator